METSIFKKLTMLCERQEEISFLLSQQEIISDQNRYRDLTREYATKEVLVTKFKEYLANQDSQEMVNEMLKEADKDLRPLVEEELQNLSLQQEKIDQEIKALLLPADPNDKRNVFLEIRAGTGGDEAAIFVGDLFRMYSRFSEDNRWRVEILSCHESLRGGYKEIICRIIGKDVYSRMKFESGVHRVQRVPLTEAQGRVHTSTCTVAVLPEPDAIEAIDINPADLKVDTFRASGAGGQHVNVTDSAIRITHIPSGTVVECQDERSQHQNRARAMIILQAKLLKDKQEKQRMDQEATRRNLVGGGERAEKIRTYNFPQSRLTDHRINLTLYNLDGIMDGNLTELVETLRREHQADLLAELSLIKDKE